jgi:HPt (histidine-containing phosphotransfer) domain-containing protein
MQTAASGETILGGRKNGGNGSDKPMDFITAVQEFGDEQIVFQVAGQLVENAWQQLGVMRRALEKDDVRRLQREAHAIKGGAWTIEARPIGNLAERIEHLCRDNAWQQIGPLMEQFENELVRLGAFINKREIPAG